MSIKQIDPRAPRTVEDLEPVLQELWTAVHTLVGVVNGLAAAPPPSGGEANTSSNVGGGNGLALAKSGVDLPFKSLLATAPVTVSNQAQTVTYAFNINNLTTQAPGSGEGFYVWQRNDGVFVKAGAV